jgi:hypothetical protein
VNLGTTFHATGPGADSESAQRLVLCVAESELFRKSPRLREFLLYVAKHTLEDRLSEVREQVIAERIFNRKPEQSGQDSIVRAEARNLRKRLELYFVTEGCNEPVIIVMPRGGYSLAFVSRSSRVSSNTLDEVPAEIEKRKIAQPLAAPPTAPLPEVAPKVAEGRRGFPALLVVLTAGTIIFASLALFWYSQNVRLRREIGEGTTPAFPFSAIFNDQQSALIVTSDTGMLQISSLLLHRRISLDDYVSRSYPSIPTTEPPNLLQNWNIYEFTDGREMTVASLLLSRNARFASHITLRSGHAVQLQDFKDNNVVLLGSPISNPWAQLYEDRLNFRCELAPEGRISFRARSPVSNEHQQFPSDDDNQHHRTYARLVFLPRAANAPAALLIAGTTAQSTQSAGEMMADPARLVRSLRTIGVDPFGRPRFFEFLIRLDNFVGGAISPEVTAWRLSPAPER